MSNKLIILLLIQFIFSSDTIQFDQKRLDNIDSLSNKLIKEKKFTGVSVYINSSDKVIYNKQIGYGNVEKTIQLDESTNYRIFSMTKPITSVALMILLERGLLNLDDPISKYLPEFKKMKRIRVLDLPIIKHLFYTRKKVDNDITIFHLLTHTSGLYYDFSSKYISVYRKYIKGAKLDIKTLEDFSNQASKLPLLFEPGTDFNYGINTDILGRIIEVVSGQDLELFLQTEIFMPLEMNSTTFNLDNSLKNLLPVYENIDGKLEISSRLNLAPIAKFPMGGAGLFSTVSDYSNFCSMLKNDGSYKGKKIISKNSIDLMSTNHIKYLDGENAKNISKRLPVVLIEDIRNLTFPMDGFGLGLYTNDHMNHQSTIANINRIGWMGAANTFFFIDPDHDFFVIIMAQSRMDFSILNDFENVIYQALEYN